MPTFSPPAALTGAQISNDPSDRPVDQTMGEWLMARRLFRHYGPRSVGRSVLKIDGVYVVVDVPSQEEIALATEVYLGGHIYSVSNAVAVALAAAGLETTPDVVVEGTWGSYAQSYWGEAQGYQWGEL